jgi:hypothetical protein
MQAFCVFDTTLKNWYMKKSLLLALFVSIFFQLSAQTVADIKAKMSVVQRNDYSKSLQLLQETNMLSQLENTDVATVLLIPNIAFEELPANISRALLVDKNPQNITHFFSNLSFSNAINVGDLFNTLQTPNGIVHLTNKAGEELAISKNGDWLMVTSPKGREANIIEHFTVGKMVIGLLSSMY